MEWGRNTTRTKIKHIDVKSINDELLHFTSNSIEVNKVIGKRVKMTSLKNRGSTSTTSLEYKNNSPNTSDDSKQKSVVRYKKILVQKQLVCFLSP